MKSLAALAANAPLKNYEIERRSLRPGDVEIEIDYCGICHSDIHQARNDWGGSRFPMVPGHEIVGRVRKTGRDVTKFAVGDIVGVGCMVDSCLACPSCAEDLQQYCVEGMVGTYGSVERESRFKIQKQIPLSLADVTYGGYSEAIVVRKEFVLKIPKALSDLNLAAVAPLLCAGITTYSPLQHWKVRSGTQVGVVGIGGLGHMAVKIAAAMGAQVTVFTTSPQKSQEARRLGAAKVVETRSENWHESIPPQLDLILNTVSAPLDYSKYLRALKRDGTFVLLGLPDTNISVPPFSLVGGRRAVAGSLIGGIKETQEMLDFCGEHKILSDIELIDAKDVNEAYTRVLKSDVKYRFVIDIKTLGKQ